MRVLVCGSRKYPDRYSVYGYLHDFRAFITSIISGMAEGPDMWAVEYARREGISIERYPAKWGTYGRQAGYIRNKEMILTKPDLVLAFWDQTSRGTNHTIDLAEKHGIECRVITP